MRRLATMVFCLLTAGAVDASADAQAPKTPQPGPELLARPPVIHERDVNCNTLTLGADGNYAVTAQPWEQPGEPVVWIVESFVPERVAFHRTVPVNQVFAGQMAPDGTGLVNVTLDGKPNAGISFSWGTRAGSPRSRSCTRCRTA